MTYCEREGVPFTLFEDWKSILETLKDIQYVNISLNTQSFSRSDGTNLYRSSGKTSLKKVAAEGAEEAKQEGKEKETTK